MRLSGVALTMSTCFLPPCSVRGMTKLNRADFRSAVTVDVVRFNGSLDRLGLFLKLLKPYILKLRQLKPFVDVHPTGKKAYLDPQRIQSVDISGVMCGGGFKNDEFSVGTEKLELTYDNWTAEDVLQAVLPVDSSMSSYSLIGHIAHVNLKDHLLSYKYLIGEVLMDKNRRCKTVVNKTDIIDNEYRNLKFEHIAGEPNYVTRVQENGFIYELDFSKVFWNSRLSTEHGRVCALCQPGDVVIDVFTGVGPFAIPAATKKCTVIANDLNANCIHWLQKNCQLNKVWVESHCMDGGRFLSNICPKRLAELHGSERTTGGVHVIMNLPALAVNFLSYLGGIGSLIPEKDRTKKLNVFVHCYMFCKTLTKTDNPEPVAEEMVRSELKDFTLGDIATSYVRNVSPYKHMIRTDFTLPDAVIFSTSAAHSDDF